MYTDRIKKIQKKLEQPLLICKPEHLLYLTGTYFFDSTFLLLFPGTRAPLLFEGTLESVKGIKNDRLKNIGAYLKIGAVLDVEGYLNLFEQRFIKKQVRGVKIHIVSSPVEQLRLVKDGEEIKALQKVADITAKAFMRVKKALGRRRFTEVELAHFIRISGIDLGAESESFPAIVAAGANAARPHHIPTSRVIKKGESVVLDFGFRLNGYCSDFTRTVFLGSVPVQLAKMYNATAEAHGEAFRAIRSGMSGAQADAIARSILKRYKLDKYFIHSLGHGTGLEVHEDPGLSPRHTDQILTDGMVFSVEPGVYIKGVGGIRIEDLVYLKNGTPRFFFTASTKLEDNIIR